MSEATTKIESAREFINSTIGVTAGAAHKAAGMALVKLVARDSAIRAEERAKYEKVVEAARAFVDLQWQVCIDCGDSNEYRKAERALESALASLKEEA